jgi:hypothetical protein
MSLQMPPDGGGYSRMEVSAVPSTGESIAYEIRAISDSRGWLDIPIAKPLFDSFAAAQRGLFEAITVEEKLNLVTENYAEFERTLVEMAVDDAVFIEHDHLRGMDQLHLVIRRLMNLLSTGLTYVDQVPLSLKRAFGRKTPHWNRFFEQLALLRKNDRFRFAEELRNHSQHFGFPVHMINSDSDQVGSGNGWRNRYRVTAKIVLKDLCEDPRFKKMDSPLLNSAGGEIDVRLIVRGLLPLN